MTAAETPRRPGWWRGMTTRYGSCCGKELRNHREYLTHNAARHGGYWAGQAGRAMARKMGKTKDALRRAARAKLEEAGLADRFGKRTAAARTRPELKGRLTLRELRSAQRHDRNHRKASRLDGKADRATGRGRPERAHRHQHRADYLRSTWGTPSRETQEKAARDREEAMRQARAAPGNGRAGQSPLNNLTRPAPSANGNRTRTPPRRAGRTRP